MSLSDRLRAMKDLRDQKKKLEEEAKELGRQAAEIEREALDLMDSQDVESQKVKMPDGRSVTFYTASRLSAKIVDADRFAEWCDKEGLDFAMFMQPSWQKLTAFYKEREEDPEAGMPEGLEAYRHEQIRALTKKAT